jgi:hypothetical protein
MSHTPITIQIDHPVLPPGPVQGFRFFWAYYVTGFNPSQHCQPCFRGTLSRQLNTSTARSGVLYVMNERRSFPYLYVCGVGIGPRSLLYQKNFHLPLKPEAGAREIRQTYNGYTIRVENGLALPIPELEVGWKGLDLETTRCKNFRFAVAQYGWKDEPQVVE